MRSLEFTKMHGLGNDFLVVDGRRAEVALEPELVRRLGDRRRGVGFDQLVLITPDPDTDAALRFFNNDGSEAGACGNGMRCAASLIAKAAGRSEIELSTAAGRHAAEILADGRVRVLLAAPRFAWQEIPLKEPADTEALAIGGDGLPPAVALSMGNPHAVFLVEKVEGLDVDGLGRRLVHHPIFAQGANIGFAQVLDGGRIRARVFERGAGLTPACGSGACAAFVAARRRGLVEEQAEIILDGGSLEVAWSGAGPVAMSGPVATSFKGHVEL